MSAIPRPPTVRPARAEDVPYIHSIYSHYVLNTITDLHHVSPSLEAFTAEYESLTSAGLPYLLATSSPRLDGTQPSSEAPEDSGWNQAQPSEARVLGFIHAFPFRGYKIGYSHTAELAIMCHPDATEKGVGSALMNSFLDAIEKDGKIDQLLAFMTVLEDEAEDKRVKDFYEKWGFRETGTLTGVGQKFGRRISKRWMQRPVVMKEQ